MASSHGTRARYNSGCDCTPCSEANRRALKLYKLRAHRAGGRTTVDAVHAQKRLLELTERMSISAAAKLTGVSHRHASRIIHGQHQRLSIDVHNRIMRADPRGDVGNHFVSARGARRRLQSLVAIGWTYSKLGDELLDGYGRSNLVQIIDGRRPYIHGPIDERIRRLWDDLCMTPYEPQDRVSKGHATRARALAKKNGWLPPLAWDDIDFDDEPPASDTDAHKGDRTLEDFDWLVANGLSEEEAASRLDRQLGSIETARRRKAA